MSLILWQPISQTRYYQFAEVFQTEEWFREYEIRREWIGHDSFEQIRLVEESSQQRPTMFMLSTGYRASGERIAILMAISGAGIPLLVTEDVMDDAAEFLGFLGEWQKADGFVVFLIDRQKCPLEQENGHH